MHTFESVFLALIIKQICVGTQRDRFTKLNCFILFIIITQTDFLLCCCTSMCVQRAIISLELCPSAQHYNVIVQEKNNFIIYFNYCRKIVSVLRNETTHAHKSKEHKRFPAETHFPYVAYCTPQKTHTSHAHTLFSFRLSNIYIYI